MMNKAMERKLLSGEALDVLKEGKQLEDGLYKLNQFIDDADYCDGSRELWIWSIGQNRKTGEILASTTTRFYQNPEFECLFLR